MSKVIDAALKEVSSLKQEVSNLENEKSRLNGELKRINSEIGELEKKKANLSSIISIEEKKLMERVSVKDKQADEKITKANDAVAKANDLLEKADKDRKEAAILKQTTNADSVNAKNLFNAAHKAKDTIVDIIKFIEDKIKTI